MPGWKYSGTPGDARQLAPGAGRVAVGADRLGNAGRAERVGACHHLQERGGILHGASAVPVIERRREGDYL
jgi:hypothetical protein